IVTGDLWVGVGGRRGNSGAISRKILGKYTPTVTCFDSGANPFKKTPTTGPDRLELIQKNYLACQGESTTAPLPGHPK
ncbi:MAG: hypothetical protein OEV89_04925, partial [Desulfobulbaceae bacterium]|nr:hypothetical protein [Desulfobulbaceae bacterium]